MESLSLYQITSAFPRMIEEEMSEEDKKEVEKELTELLQQKSQNLIGYTRNMELTIEAMKNEEERISKQRKALENNLKKFDLVISTMNKFYVDDKEEVLLADDGFDKFYENLFPQVSNISINNIKK